MRILCQTIAAHRDLRLVLIAGLVSLTGDWALRVGLAYYIYVLTGSTLASAAMLLASFAPQLVLGSVAGVFVDRWNRRRTMVASNLLLAAGLLPLALVTTPGRSWIIYVVLAWEGCVQQFFLPAEQSLIPHLVPTERLVTANALAAQTRDIGRLVGSAVGGVVIGIGGVSLLTAVDATSFVLAAGLLRLVPAGGARPPRAQDDEVPVRLRGRISTLRTQWASGLRLAGHDQVLRVVMIFMLVATFGEGIMGTLFAPFVHDALDGTSRQYGQIVSVQAIGGIGGGLLAAGLGDRIRPALLLGWGAVAFGAIDLVMFVYPLWYAAVWPALICMIVVGLPGAVLFAGAFTLLQRYAPDDHRGRIFGALGAIQGASTIVGTVLAGVLGDQVGIIPILVIQGAGYLLAGLAVIATLRHEPATPHVRAAPSTTG